MADELAAEKTVQGNVGQPGADDLVVSKAVVDSAAELKSARFVKNTETDISISGPESTYIKRGHVLFPERLAMVKSPKGWNLTHIPTGMFILNNHPKEQVLNAAARLNHEVPKEFWSGKKNFSEDTNSKVRNALNSF